MIQNSSRRNFLKSMGFGGLTLFLEPLFFSVISQALGAASAADRKRLIIVSKGNALANGNLKGNSLPEILKPLSGFQDRLTVVRGLFCSKGREFHGARNHLFTCTEPMLKGFSIDRVIAKEVAANDPFGVLVFHAETPEAQAGGGGQPVITSSPGSTDSALVYPKEIIDKIFSYAGLSPGKNNFSARINALDKLVSEDSRLLIKKLANEEKAKIEGYLNTVEEAQKSYQNLMDSGGCAAPSDPGISSTRPDSSNETVVSLALYDKIIDFHIDALVLAQSCGLNHIATMSYGSQYHPFLQGIMRAKYNSIWHSSLLANDGSSTNFQGKSIRAIEGFYISKIKKMYEKMQSAGIANNSLILFTSPSGGHHHSIKDSKLGTPTGCHNLPVVMLGNLSGSNLKLGAGKDKYNLIDLPFFQYSMRDFWVTIANAIGSKIKNFGDSNFDKFSGPIKILLN